MKVDIHSKGEIASFLDKWAQAGVIKKCLHLRLDRYPDRHYKVVCTEDWASRVPGNNVDLVNWDGTRSPYLWPKCPENCPHYMESKTFLKSATRDQYDDQQQASDRKTSAVEVVVKSKDLQPPPKYTAQWIWTHGHYSVWLWFASLLLAAVGVGFSVGRWSVKYEQTVIRSPAQIPALPGDSSKTTVPSTTTKADAQKTGSRK